MLSFLSIPLQSISEIDCKECFENSVFTLIDKENGDFKNLFYGFPDLWGGGVAHSVMILSLVIALGLCLGKLRVKGVSLGLAWILFIGLIFGHFSLNLDEHLLHFLKEFGLILFVYSIGLEVGPGFFASFKNGGKSLNLLSMIVVALSIITTLVIFSFREHPSPLWQVSFRVP